MPDPNKSPDSIDESNIDFKSIFKRLPQESQLLFMELTPGQRKGIRDIFVDDPEGLTPDKMRAEIARYETEKTHIVDSIRSHRITEVININEIQGKGFHLAEHEEIKTEIIDLFLSKLHSGFVDDAIRIRDRLMGKLDVAKIPGYSEAVKFGFINAISCSFYRPARKLYDEFGSGLNINNDPEVIETMETALEKEAGNNNKYNLKNLFHELADFFDFTKFRNFNDEMSEYLAESQRLGTGEQPVDAVINETPATAEEPPKSAVPAPSAQNQHGIPDGLHSLGRNDSAPYISLETDGTVGAVEFGVRDTGRFELPEIKRVKREREIAAAKQTFIVRLSEANMEALDMIHNRFKDEIVYAKLEGFDEALRQGFLKALQENRDEDAMRLRDEYGREYDFTAELTTILLLRMYRGDVRSCLRIAWELGKDNKDDLKNHLDDKSREILRQNYITCLIEGRNQEADDIAIHFPGRDIVQIIQALKIIDTGDSVIILNEKGPGHQKFFQGGHFLRTLTGKIRQNCTR